MLKKIRTWFSVRRELRRYKKAADIAWWIYCEEQCGQSFTRTEMYPWLKPEIRKWVDWILANEANGLKQEFNDRFRHAIAQRNAA